MLNLTKSMFHFADAVIIDNEDFQLKTPGMFMDMFDKPVFLESNEFSVILGIGGHMFDAVKEFSTTKNLQFRYGKPVFKLTKENSFLTFGIINKKDKENYKNSIVYQVIENEFPGVKYFIDNVFGSTCGLYDLNDGFENIILNSLKDVQLAICGNMLTLDFVKEFEIPIEYECQYTYDVYGALSREIPESALFRMFQNMQFNNAILHLNEEYMSDTIKALFKDKIDGSSYGVTEFFNTIMNIENKEDYTIVIYLCFNNILYLRNWSLSDIYNSFVKGLSMGITHISGTTSMLKEINK